MRPFHALTPLGQTRRLRGLAETALGRFGLRPARLRLLQWDNNGIFRVDTDDGRRLVLRVARPGHRSPDAMRAEASWLRHLATVAPDLGAPDVVTTDDGETVVVVGADGVPDARACLVMTWVPGGLLVDRPTPRHVRAWGALLARLHEVSPPGRLDIPTHDRVLLSKGDGLLSGRHIEAVGADLHGQLTAAARAAQQLVDQLHRDAPRLSVLHGDLHQWNVKVSRGRALPIDFEDITWGVPLQDVAITSYYLARLDGAAQLCDHLRAGYESVRPWPAGDDDHLVATLTAGHAAMMVDLVLTHEDPVVRGYLPRVLDGLSGRLAGWVAGPSRGPHQL